MKMQQSRGALVLCATGLVLCTLYGVTLAQTATLSSPIAVSNSIYGEGLYFYNPGSQNIISPVESGNALTMVPYQSYYSSMQWVISIDGVGPSVYISSASAGEDDGCDSGTNAFWNAPKGVAVTTSCNPVVTQYTNFIFFQAIGTNTYVIAPLSNIAGCVTIINNVPTIPLSPCNRFTASSLWQLVSISQP